MSDKSAAPSRGDPARELAVWVSAGWALSGCRLALPVGGRLEAALDDASLLLPAPLAAFLSVGGRTSVDEMLEAAAREVLIVPSWKGDGTCDVRLDEGSARGLVLRTGGEAEDVGRVARFGGMLRAGLGVPEVMPC